MRFLSALMVTIFSCQLAAAHGVPIIVSGSEGQVTTDHTVYNAELEPLAETLATDLPGFGIISSSAGVDVGTLIQLEVIDKLWFWDPATMEPGPTASTLVIENANADSVSVNAHTIVLPPLSIGEYNGFAGWHRHLDYYLDPSNSPGGAYGLVFRLLAEPLAPSDPLLVVFGNFTDGFDEAAMPPAIAGLQAAIFSPLPGDADRNGKVDLADFNILKAHFGSSPAAWSQGDFNGNFLVDLADFNLLKANFGTSRALPAPEPHGASLLVWGGALIGLGCFRPRRPRPTPAGRERSPQLGASACRAPASVLR